MWLNVRELELSPTTRLAVSVSGGCFGGGVVTLTVARLVDGAWQVGESLALPDAEIESLASGLLEAQREARRVVAP